MSDAFQNNPPMQGSASVGIGDVVTTLKIANQNSSLLIQAINALTAVLTAAFPQVTGTFTLGAAATTVVTQTNTKTNSIVLLMPSNAAAATLMGSAKALYVSARSAGASFTVATANAAAAAGTETFSYTLINPL